MIIPTQAAQNRIEQLIQMDNQTDEQLDQYYKQCMAYISAHITAFFSAYAQDNQLTLVEASQRASQWDLQQFRDAVMQFDIRNYPDEAIDRLKGYQVFANPKSDRKHVLEASIAVLILGMTVQSYNLINKRIVNDGQQQLTNIAKRADQDTNDVIKAVNGNSVITEQKNVDIWSANLWKKSDEMANDVEILVNKHLKHGMSLNDLHSILAEHANPKQFKPTQSLADRVKQMEFNTRRIVRTESARLINYTNVVTYQQVGVKKVGIELQPGACPKCQEKQDGGPYRINDAPYVPIHPSCRCIIIPKGTMYEQFVVRLKDMISKI